MTVVTESQKNSKLKWQWKAGRIRKLKWPESPKEKKAKKAGKPKGLESLNDRKAGMQELAKPNSDGMMQLIE